jgi:hypothetical protein
MTAQRPEILDAESTLGGEEYPLLARKEPKEV